MPTLLSLPAELRLKIYSYLLTTPSHPPSFSYLNSPRSQRPKYPRFIVQCPQILRVNRQIHDEASQVLYGGNEFVVWIGVFGEWCSSGEVESGRKGKVVGWWSCPWESWGVGVQFEEGFLEKHHYRQSPETMRIKYYPNGHFDSSIPPLSDNNISQTPLLPSKYSQLIKHLRIEIFEERITPAWNIPYNPPKLSMQGYNPQYLLLPIYTRLDQLLLFQSNNGGLVVNVDVDVKVFVHAALTSDPEFYCGGRWDEQEGFEWAVRVKPTFLEYKGLIQTVWGFTRGGWRKYTVKLPEMLEEMFGGGGGEVVEGVLKECDEGEMREGRRRRGGVNVGMVEWGMWVRSAGRRLFVLKSIRG
ncbi:hypothetical protein TWF192_004673 [Orbilia oligospora]|uniref:F-box domain-containing protein n=1 Tax=Orbilia oligospora TaxID=2813651 RepID=A0A6G1LQ84_ORBOL|nr:hypothetical protein TWF679_003234 [Orbilia oligospora]KAF3200821.1 hypothetical protein TWF191_003533 [Orbilia oligospora]KAF3230466.1 hypothetical protein TWF192_004673 [Orbilia oligospora]